MTRNDLQTDLRLLVVSDLMASLQAKIISQIEETGFKLELNCDKPAELAVIAIDSDAFYRS